MSKDPNEHQEDEERMSEDMMLSYCEQLEKEKRALEELTEFMTEHEIQEWRKNLK